jgi:hypothetical protein
MMRRPPPRFRRYRDSAFSLGAAATSIPAENESASLGMRDALVEVMKTTTQKTADKVTKQLEKLERMIDDARFVDNVNDVEKSQLTEILTRIMRARQEANRVANPLPEALPRRWDSESCAWIDPN